MSIPLLLFPFGGNAREAYITISDINSKSKTWEILGFIDDEKSKIETQFIDTSVIGGKNKLNDFPDSMVLAVPGNPKTYLKRKQIINDLKISDNKFATIIHPSVSIASNATIGYNTLIMPNVVISSDVKIGNHCIIMANTVVSHDSKISDYCCIGSNISISGNVTIGENCFVGSRSSIIDNVKIGDQSMIGIGSNVINNVDERIVAAGNPAKKIRDIKD